MPAMALMAVMAVIGMVQASVPDLNLKIYMLCLLCIYIDTYIHTYIFSGNGFKTDE